VWYLLLPLRVVVGLQMLTSVTQLVVPKTVQLKMEVGNVIVVHLRILLPLLHHMDVQIIHVLKLMGHILEIHLVHLPVVLNVVLQHLLILKLHLLTTIVKLVIFKDKIM
jgi:hypothetical protein